MRAGVVNLWEFDVAEYWFADGRAQLAGGNQSGKSTLMALTTLILLTGNLERQALDTFGQTHKSFRYYLEPSADDEDRRDATATNSRGWAWIEYARQTSAGPEYYTCALYADVRRSAATINREWMIATGPRVREDLTLHAGQAVTAAKDFASMPGVTLYRSGRQYSERQARDLFEFTDADRLGTLTSMLAILRQPHLGQKLNPDYFTEQMRSALPAIDEGEIAQLADGWEQLDKLAEDRDSAERALTALTVFIDKAYNPWAASVLRSRADALVAAVTRFDDVTRERNSAERSLQQVQQRSAELEAEIERLSLKKVRARTRRDTLAESEQIKDAQEAQARIAQLRIARAGAHDRLAKAGTAREEAEQGLAAAGADLEQARTELAAAEAVVQDQILATTGLAAAAGLPDPVPVWLADGDLPRVGQAITERSTALRTMRTLQRRRVEAATRLDGAHKELQSAETRLRQAGEEDRAAGAGWADATQSLSDAVEGWAAGVGDDLAAAANPESVVLAEPSPAQRTGWVTEVIAAAEGGSRTAGLRRLVERTWRDPLAEQLNARAARHGAEAVRAGSEVAELEAKAAEVATQTDDAPPPPVTWGRRSRPKVGTSGAPLWRLLDPADPAVDLDILEATLSAAGLLDSWVTADGEWLSDRDGNDTVVTTTAPWRGRTLADVCRVTDDANDLADVAAAVARSIAVIDEGADLPADAVVSVCLDGRWATKHAAGRAEPAPHGASWIGTGARAAARARRVAELTAQAERRRADAQAATSLQRVSEGLLALVAGHADGCPDDASLIGAATAARAAAAALAKAEAHHAQAESEAAAAEQRAAQADSKALGHAGQHRLPADDAELDNLDGALSTVSSVLTTLATQMGLRRAADARVTEREKAERDAELRRTTATESHRSAVNEYNKTNIALQTAEVALTSELRDLLTALDTARREADEVEKEHEAARDRRVPLAEERTKAEAQLALHEQRRQDTDSERSRTLAAFLVPLRAGLAAAMPDDLSIASESLTNALDAARTVRQKVQPPAWKKEHVDPDGAVRRAWTMVTNRLLETRVLLEAAGQRSLSQVDPDPDEDGTDTDDLPAVTVTVDFTTEATSPWEARRRLAEQVKELTDAHDSKLAEVLTELLSSTFVNHLRSRAIGVDDLLARINRVLAAHPTGANRAVLRLQRQQSIDSGQGYRIIEHLTRGFLDRPGVQDDIREFLHMQVSDAQQWGKSNNLDWKTRLAELLDYRRWFDVVAHSKVASASSWKPLTKEKHSTDSGGGKAVTLLQPLLATLVALYDETPQAPRPVWIDEAFAGVDDANRAQMLDLLTAFDLDFLMAGPGTLVASSVVPAAAVWHVSRAPAPHPGVDLSLALWTGADRARRVIDTDFTRNLSHRSGTVTARRGTDATGTDALFDLSDPVPS
jgi:hypothetical protein